jgi:pimeloyl-ACP methyl ester carboxylesterase
MAEVTAGGIRFHIQRLPAHRLAGSTNRPTHPPTVVFVHGLVIDNMSSFYYTLANPAARAGADVILYDLRGHGGTERPRTGYSLEASVRDLIALLDAIGVTEPVHLVGNSFGGTIALALTMAHPDRVASLLLIEAAVVTEDWVEQTARMLAMDGPELLAVLRGKGLRLRGDLLDRRPEHGREVDRFYAVVDALLNGTTLAADLAAVQPFPSASLQSVACPVVATYGEDSDIIHHAYTLKHLLPNCDLTVVPNCSHFLLAEAPGAVRMLLLRWLSSDAVAKRMSVEKEPVR